MRYYDLTNEQRAALDEEGLVNAIIEEALHRGVVLPIPGPGRLPGLMDLSRSMLGTPGVQEVWLVQKNGDSYLPNGLAFLSRETAEAAMQQMVVIEKHYRSNLPYLDNRELVVRPITVYPEKVAEIHIAAVEEDEPDRTAFDALMNACKEDYETLRRTAYKKDKKRRIKQEYLNAAKGDEEIAKAFYAKAFPGSVWEAEEGCAHPAPEPVAGAPLIHQHEEREPMDRRHLLNPDCTPRYLRCYDTGPGVGDRYTLVFTGRRAEGRYVGSNCVPTHPAFGVWQHGQADRVRGPYPIDVNKYGWPPAMGRTNHLGRRVPFSSLPEEVRNLAVREYCELWDIEVPR